MEKASWVTNQIRGIFASINYCIYSAIEWIMQGIFDIASININSGLINDVYMKIYVVLGIFMTFKLTISLLQYMVNPEKLTDKEKGASKLISRAIVMLIMLIFLPSLFPILNRVQTEFLPVLPKIILNSDTDNSSSVPDNANLMATSALGAFFRPADGMDPADRPDPITSVSDIMDHYKDKTSGYYDYEFNYIYAIGAGVAIVIILILMTIKIGIRLFKMLILQLIAPIPIMSYIDPKSAKDGAFASWLKQLMSTFFDIFIRLGVIYFVLMLLSALADGTLFAESTSLNVYTKVFLIIALLMFAKDAPNFVKDAFGIKHDKDTSGGLAAITGGIMGAATGTLSGAISGRGLRGAITGFTTGLNAGWQGGMTGKKADAFRAAGDAAKQARTGNDKAKSGFLNSMQEKATHAQLSRSAAKLNLSLDTIDSAKDNMIKTQEMAAQAQRNYQTGLQTGHFFDLNGTEIDMSEAAKIVDDTTSASNIATKNYEKANKAGDYYKINRSFAEDYKANKRKAKPDYKSGTLTRPEYKAKGKFDPAKGSYTPGTYDPITGAPIRPGKIRK